MSRVLPFRFRPSPVALALLLLLAAPATAQLRAYDDDVADGGAVPGVLQAVDGADGSVGVPPEFAGCPAAPPNTVFAVGFTSGYAHVDGVLHGLHWAGADIFLHSMASSFCATGTPIGAAPVGFANLEALAFRPEDGMLYSADFDFASHLARLVRIDPATGLGSLAGLSFPRNVRITGMVHEPETGLLLALATGHGGGEPDARGSELWTVDVDLLVAAPVGGTGVAPATLESLALDFSADPPRLLTGGTSLHLLDRPTGQATELGGGFNGTLWAMSAPEPSCDPDGPDADFDGTADCLDGCPDDGGKTEPGACGCGFADIDTDFDGTPDCHDGCPFHGGKTQPGLCGCAIADTDGDGDGTPDCFDECPDDAGKTAPGACGCGVVDADGDGDGILDCHEECPNDPDKFLPGACGCGVPDVDRDGDTEPDCGCVAGDLHPAGSGDDRLDLADWLLAFRKTGPQGLPVLPWDATCADLAPFASSCEAASVLVLCPEGDGVFDELDQLAMRPAAAGLHAFSCEPCLEGDPAAAPLQPGEVAPRGAPNGVLDVSDVLVILQWAVGNEPPEPGSPEFRRADVSPAAFDGLLRAVEGDGALGVADVLLVLRAAVGLELLGWPERQVLVRLTEALEHAAFSCTVSGWPEAALVTSFASASCDLGGGGLDGFGDACAVTCASDPVSLVGPAELARFGYRAMDAVPTAGLELTARFVGSDLTVSEGSVELASD